MASAKTLRPVPWKVSDTVWLMLGYWLVLPVALVLLIMAGAHFWQPVATFADLWRKDDLAVSFTLNAAIDAVGFGLIWLIVRRRGGAWRDLGWRRFGVLKALGAVLGAFVAFILVAASVSWVVEHYLPLYNVNQPQVNEFTGKGIGSLWALVALVVMPPIFEETIFRGFILPAFVQKMGFWPGAVLLSLLFGLVHGQANVGVYTFILSMVFCYLYRRFDSIVPGMLLHMLNNLVTYWVMVKAA